MTLRRLLIFSITASLLLLCLAAPPRAEAGQLAINAIALLDRLGIYPDNTYAYGIDDLHGFFGAEDQLVAGIQHIAWVDNRRARVTSIFGLKNGPLRNESIASIAPFPSGQVSPYNEHLLTFAGITYPPSELAMLPFAEIQQRLPGVDLSVLGGSRGNLDGADDGEYAVVVWDVEHATGERINAGWMLSTGYRAMIDRFTAPVSVVEGYRTLAVDCECVADRHRLLAAANLEILATHHHRPAGPQPVDGNLVVSVIGVRGSAVGDDPWAHLAGFREEHQLELYGDSEIVDGDGRRIASTPRLMSAEQLRSTFQEMTFDYLGGEGLYVVDVWDRVNLPGGVERGNAISNVAVDVRINGRRIAFSATVEETGGPLGRLDLAGTLFGAAANGVDVPTKGFIPEEVLLSHLVPIIVQPSGIIIDAQVGVLAQVGDSARGVYRIGDRDSLLRGTLIETATVVRTDPWTLAVEFNGSLRLEAADLELPLGKEIPAMRVDAGRASAVGRLFSSMRGNSVEVPFDLRVSWQGSGDRPLPATFGARTIIDALDPETGAFSGNLERQDLPLDP